MNGSRRVALVLPNLTLGGAERQAVELARRLPAHGWQPILLVAEMHGPLLDVVRENQLETHDLRARLWLPKYSPAFWWNLGSTINRIARICDDRSALILQSFLYWQNQLAVPAFLRSRFVRAVVTGRRNLGNFKDSRRHYQAIENLANRRSSAVVCNSELVRVDTLRRERICPSKVRVISNGVDVERFQSAAPYSESELPEILRDAAPLIGTVGNLKRQKRHDLFLQVIARIREQLPGARGVIVGRDLGEQVSLLRLRAELGLENVVHLAGGSDAPERWLRTFDAFLLSSDFEGMPNVVLEAMAAGCPVVSTTAGGAQEIIRTGVTGLLVPVGDVEAMAASVVRIASDRELAGNFAARATQLVQDRFSLDAMAGAYAALYGELLAT